jgi:hypothetical protein
MKARRRYGGKVPHISVLGSSWRWVVYLTHWAEGCVSPCETMDEMVKRKIHSHDDNWIPVTQLIATDFTNVAVPSLDANVNSLATEMHYAYKCVS